MQLPSVKFIVSDGKSNVVIDFYRLRRAVSSLQYGGCITARNNYTTFLPIDVLLSTPFSARGLLSHVYCIVYDDGGTGCRTRGVHHLTRSSDGDGGGGKVVGGSGEGGC